MKLRAETGGEPHDVEIRRDGERLFARVGDRNYELEVSEPESGVFLFKNGGNVTEAFVSVAQDTGKSFSVRINSSELDVTISDPKRLRSSAAVSDAAGGRAEIKTAMPGKVVRILAIEGAEVQKGDGLIVVEAMKMQNEMRSPKDGTVAEIRVGEGDTVGAGDVLMIIE